MATLLWLEGGACSGNTMSFLNAEEPTAVDLVTDFGIEVIWHPSLGMELGEAAQQIMRDCASGARQVDIFVYEGPVLTGPNGTGRYDMFAERPMKEWVAEIAPRAGVVVAVGDCSSWGGIPATPPNPTDAIGLQYLKGERGGFLGKDFTSTLGLPVVNIPGCPAHPDWITQVVVALAAGRVGDIALDDLQRPKTFFSIVHPDRVHARAVLRVQAVDDGLRPGHPHRLPVLRVRLPRPDDPLAVQPDPVEPPVEQDARGSALHRAAPSRATRTATSCPGTMFKTAKVSGSVPKEVPTGTDHLTYMAHAAAARIAAPQWSKEDMFVV